MDWLCGFKVIGLFAAGGTGEFFSLTPAEIEKVVTIAVAETWGRLPVVAAAGYGTAIAKNLAAAPSAPGPTVSCCCRPISSTPGRTG